MHAHKRELAKRMCASMLSTILAALLLCLFRHTHCILSRPQAAALDAECATAQPSRSARPCYDPSGPTLSERTANGVSRFLYPGTPHTDEQGLRITALGTGTPHVWPSQVSTGYLIELGNNNTFLFDLGGGLFGLVHNNSHQQARR